MAPQAEDEAPLAEEEQRLEKLVAPSADDWRFQLTRHRVPLLMFTISVLMGFYGAYVFFTEAKLLTVVFTLAMTQASMLGLTAGAHRLWAHRAYRAAPPLEALLALLFLLANQRSIETWVKTHRLHHKYADTDADPHNAARGFFFAHFWWMLVDPHPQVKKRLKYIDLSDLRSNPIVRFQQKHLILLLVLVAFAFPTCAPRLWGESWHVAFFCNLFRLNVVLHLINSINSVTHLLAYKPVDASAAGTQSQLAGSLTCGEGFHNYHHAFPRDYRASEFGDTKYNLAAMFIALMARVGLAYDLRVTPEAVVRARVLAKGDGTDMYYVPNNGGKQAFFNFKFYKNKVKSCIGGEEQ